MTDCDHTQFGECVFCGAVLEHTIIGFPKPRKRVEDPAYRTFVRGLVCCAILLDGPGHCRGDNVAHHARGGTMARKADDDTCICLCVKHHNDWHAASGPFTTWKKPRRTEWSEEYISETRSMWRQRLAYLDGAA